MTLSNLNAFAVIISFSYDSTCLSKYLLASAVSKSSAVCFCTTFIDSCVTGVHEVLCPVSSLSFVFVLLKKCHSLGKDPFVGARWICSKFSHSLFRVYSTRKVISFTSILFNTEEEAGTISLNIFTKTFIKRCFFEVARASAEECSFHFWLSPVVLLWSNNNDCIT